MNKEEILQVIKESFCSIYCDTCEHNKDEDKCDFCHKEYMRWEVSNKYAEFVAERIMGIAKPF